MDSNNIFQQPPNHLNNQGTTAKVSAVPLSGYEAVAKNPFLHKYINYADRDSMNAGWADTKITVSGNLPPKRQYLLSVWEDGELIGLLSPGSIGAISGESKSGKSYLAGQIVTSFLKKGEHLNFQTDASYMAYYDTEQEKDFTESNMYFNVKNAGLQRLPDNITVRNVTVYNFIERLIAIYTEIAKLPTHSIIIIDGIQDLAADINDNQEARAMITMFATLAHAKQSSIIFIIHDLEKGVDKGQMRGAFGSVLRQKLTTQIQLIKDSETNEYRVRFPTTRGQPVSEFTYRREKGNPKPLYTSGTNAPDFEF